MLYSSVQWESVAVCLCLIFHRGLQTSTTDFSVRSSLSFFFSLLYLHLIITRARALSTVAVVILFFLRKSWCNSFGSTSESLIVFFFCRLWRPHPASKQCSIQWLWDLGELVEKKRKNSLEFLFFFFGLAIFFTYCALGFRGNFDWREADSIDKCLETTIFSSIILLKFGRMENEFSFSISMLWIMIDRWNFQIFALWILFYNLFTSLLEKISKPSEFHSYLIFKNIEF